LEGAFAGVAASLLAKRSTTVARFIFGGLSDAKISLGDISGESDLAFAASAAAAKIEDAETAPHLPPLALTSAGALLDEDAVRPDDVSKLYLSLASAVAVLESAVEIFSTGGSADSVLSFASVGESGSRSCCLAANTSATVGRVLGRPRRNIPSAKAAHRWQQ
jgi:hypothetical protein